MSLHENGIFNDVRRSAIAGVLVFLWTCFPDNVRAGGPERLRLVTQRARRAHFHGHDMLQQLFVFFACL